MKKFLSMILALSMVMALFAAVPITASAETSGKCGDNVYWTLDDSGVLTISGTGAMWDYNFFHSPFTYISNVKTAVIQAGVTTVGECVFFYCGSLTSVTLPNSVTSIGSFAFSNCCDLTEMAIPDSVTSIGYAAFQECRGLTEIVVPSSVTDIGSYAFATCDSLTSVTIRDSVTSIGDDAFSCCFSLTDVYYGGSAEEWAKIQIGRDNENLTNANIHYNSQMPGNEKEDNKIKVYLNGKLLEFDQEPVIEGGRTLVPIRTIAEALGSFVEWDEKTQTAIIQRGIDTAVFQIGKDKAYAKNIKKLDVGAKIINGRTLIPLRAIAEVFGAQVEWNSDTREILINCEIYSEEDIFTEFKQSGFIHFNYYVDSFMSEHADGDYVSATIASNMGDWAKKIVIGAVSFVTGNGSFSENYNKDQYKAALKIILANITEEKSFEFEDTIAEDIFSGMEKGANLSASELNAHFEKEFPGSSAEFSYFGSAKAAKYMKTFADGMEKLTDGIDNITFAAEEWAYLIADYSSSMEYLDVIRQGVKSSNNKALNKAIDELEQEFTEKYTKVLRDAFNKLSGKAVGKGLSALLNMAGSSAGSLYSMTTFGIESVAKLFGATEYASNVESVIYLMAIDNNLKFYNDDLAEKNYDFLTDSMLATADETTWSKYVDSFEVTKACTLEAYKCMLAVTKNEPEKIYLERQIDIIERIMISDELPKSASRMFYFSEQESSSGVKNGSIGGGGSSGGRL